MSCSMTGGGLLVCIDKPESDATRLRCIYRDTSLEDVNVVHGNGWLASSSPTNEGWEKRGELTPARKGLLTVTTAQGRGR